MRPTLLLLLFLYCFAPAAAQERIRQAGLSEAGLERYTDWLKQEIAAGRLPMAEAIIYRNGEVGYHKILGKSNVETGTPLEENQVYHIMSMTKPIVSVAFMMLYEEGHFRLRDRVAQYLPEFGELRVARNVNEGLDVATDPAETEVTIEQLLTHTAGFSHGLGGTAFDNAFAETMYYRPQSDIADRVSTLASLPLVSEPGEMWYYSASPDVLARLIEHFSGRTVAEFLQQRIFDPLEMENTGYNVAAEQTQRVVANHGMVEDVVQLAGFQLPTSGNTVYGGTHGLYSTAADYLRFCRMLLNGGELDGQRLLSRKTVELMTMNHVGELREQGQGFGLGFGVVVDPAEADVAGSAGAFYWSGAYSTYFLIDPAEEMIAILMSQRSPYSGFHFEMMQQMVYQALGE